jgi:hypothetical protein
VGSWPWNRFTILLQSPLILVLLFSLRYMQSLRWPRLPSSGGQAPLLVLVLSSGLHFFAQPRANKLKTTPPPATEVAFFCVPRCRRYLPRSAKTVCLKAHRLKVAPFISHAPLVASVAARRNRGLCDCDAGGCCYYYTTQSCCPAASDTAYNPDSLKELAAGFF